MNENHFDVEMSFLGWILNNNRDSRLYNVLDTVQPHYLQKPEHQRIYEAIIETYVKEKNTSFTLIATVLEQKNMLEKVGGAYYISDLSQKACDGFEIKGVVGHLVMRWKNRECEKNLNAALKELTNGGDVDTVYENFTDKMYKLKRNDKKSIVPLSTAIEQLGEELQAEREGKQTWFSTGLPGIDKMLNGLRKGRLYVLGAEEKTGKSLLANQIGLNIAETRTVGIISLEMKAKEIAKRYAGISDRDDVESNFQRLMAMKPQLERLPIYIGEGGETGTSLLSTLRYMVTIKKADFVIVDYLQLVSFNGKNEEKRVDEINNVMALLKTAAIELDIPIILIAAVLNKQIGTRATRKPISADLRDSGRIANDCDCLLFLWKPDEENDATYLELFVSRSRNGESGKCGLYLNPGTLRLEETPLRDVSEKKQYSTETYFN